jgi:hypothetical protein
MKRLLPMLTIALLLTPAAAQAGLMTSHTKGLPAVQTVGIAPNFKIVFTQPQGTGTDPAEQWPGHPDDCEGYCDPPSPLGSDDPPTGTDEPSTPADDDRP